MLIARNHDHKLCNLAFFKGLCREAVKKESWYCPCCGERVLVKWGSVKMPHFAHQNLQDCQYFSEGESAEHLGGKALLAKWCEFWQTPYQLEAYLPELEQRPDLLVDGRIAVEFQCSPLSVWRMIERTEGYLKGGYQVWWILGEKVLPRKEWGELQAAFLQHSSEKGFYFWHLNVASGRLVLCRQLSKSMPQKDFLHFGVSKEIQDGALPVLFKLPQQVSKDRDCHQLAAQRELQKRVQQVRQKLYYRDSELLKLQEASYLSGANLFFPPPAVLIPTASEILLRKDAIYYHLALLEMLSKKEEWQVDSLAQAVFLLFRESGLIFRENPFLSEKKIFALYFNEYLNQLARLGLLKTDGQRIYRIVPLVWYHQEEGYQKAQAVFLEQTRGYFFLC